MPARHLARLRRALTATALLGVALAAAAPHLGGWWAPADLAAQFLLQAATGTGLLATALLVLRRWREAVVAGLCLAVQLVTLLPHVGPPGGTAAASSPADTMSVLLLNAWADNPGGPELEAFLRGQDADLLVLLETSREVGPVLERLGDVYPSRASSCPGRRRRCDLVLLAKRPWRRAPGIADPAAGVRMIDAELDGPGGPLTVVAAHLSRPIAEGALALQLRQAETIGRTLAGVTGAAVVLGDLNAVPWGRLVRTLETATGFRALPGLEGTWHAALPWPLRLPIDHVLLSPGLAAVERLVLRAPGSDHRAVRVTLAAGGSWPPPDGP